MSRNEYKKAGFGKNKSSLVKRNGPMSIFNKKRLSKPGPEEGLVLDILPRNRPSMLPLIASPAAAMQMKSRHPTDFLSGFSTLTHRNANNFKSSAHNNPAGFSYAVSPIDTLEPLDETVLNARLNSDIIGSLSKESVDATNELQTKTPGRMRIEIGEMLPSVVSPLMPTPQYDSDFRETPFGNSRMAVMVDNHSHVTE